MGEHLPDWSSVPSNTGDKGRDTCLNLMDGAEWTRLWLEDSIGQHSEGSNPERRALHGATNVVAVCEAALRSETDEGLTVKRFVAQHGDAGSLYRVEAALYMIPRLGSEVSDYQHELRRLPSVAECGITGWCTALGDRAPAVVTQWHRWLFTTFSRAGGVEYSNGEILALACGELSTGLAAVTRAA
jgi:hypothetical protein